MTGSGDDRAALRRRLRLERRRLPAAERQAAAQAVARRLASLGLPKPRSRIGAYVPIDAELDPAPIIALARRRGCRIYVPVITSFSARHMRFAPLDEGRDMRPNRWGIHEPEGTGINGRWLDLVLVPCVAFDDRGGRLGLGAGFYDRHFAFLSQRRAWRRPFLLGLGYELQRVRHLVQQRWDVPLHGVVTERAACRVNAGSRDDCVEEGP